MTKTTSLPISAEKLSDFIVEGLLEKKGLEITRLDLRSIPQAVCDFFVICTGTSNTHVNGLADSVDGFVKKKTGEDAWHVEGYRQGDWVLIDYINVVVHIFQPEARTFYALEKLWADAPAKNFSV
jgi:ribosome-associated protein